MKSPIVPEGRNALKQEIKSQLELNQKGKTKTKKTKPNQPPKPFNHKRLFGIRWLLKFLTRPVEALITQQVTGVKMASQRSRAKV